MLGSSKAMRAKTRCMTVTINTSVQYMHERNMRTQGSKHLLPAHASIDHYAPDT
jgi:hypothetical protein